MTFTASPAASKFLRIHAYVVMFFVCLLSVTTILKIGDVQYLELLLAADLPILLLAFAMSGFRVRVFRPFLRIGRSYFIFLVFAFLLAILALRQDFTLADETFLRQPLVVTVSRMAELVLDVTYMLYLASCSKEDEKLCIFGAKVYYWTAIAGGLYSVLSFPLNYAYGVALGTYGDSHRMRGFNIEGGPYGVYLVTVIALIYAVHRKGWLSRAQTFWGSCLMFVCLIGSQSKAAFFVLALLFLFYLVWSSSGWKRFTLIGTTALVFLVAAVVVDLPGKIEVYEQASNQYQKLSNLRSEDANFVMGRVAGAVLSPRMIAAHPLVGIGWGNYPLVRDDPEYRRGSSFSMYPGDAPGLGLIDYVVELGIPLWVYLTWILMKPAYYLRRSGADPRVVALAALHPLVVSLGTHLNLIYPWAVVALALGMGFNRWHAVQETPAVPVAKLD
jgi:hypothetical protein